MQVKIINNSSNPLPTYQTAGAAAVDLHAFCEEDIVLSPVERVLIKTGIQIELPEGYEAQIRPRSGLAYKNGVTVLNSPGTIDSDYRGDVGVILINHGQEPFIIKNGDRIAQMVFAKVEQVDLIEVEDVSGSERGEGGFGSTKI